MGLEETGNVVYYGFFASFFGGWVPVRAKNLKLIVFHLYLLLSLLLFPLVIYIVDSTRIAGWVVYGLFIAVTFVILKITNYRLHKALGSDPPPESEATPSLDESNDQDVTSEDRGLEEGGPQEGEKINHTVVLMEDSDPSTISRHRSSASTLNEGGSGQHADTPEIELSQISQPAETNVTATESDNGDIQTKEVSPLPSDSPETSERSNSRSRQRVCHRNQRQDSRSSRRGTEQTESVDAVNKRMKDVQDVLSRGPYPRLATVVDKMPSALQEAILNQTVSTETLEALVPRVDALRAGHLAVDDNDSTGIHWFAEEGSQWHFYTFDSPVPETEEDDQDVLESELFRHQIEAFRPPTPPRPSTVDHTAAVTTEIPAPFILVIPRVSKTKLMLNFTRRQLEDYMDRNVSRSEVAVSVILAVLVCVIAALLLTVVDFYNGFLVFALCFVIATTHFSLIKSVQSDPASPSPGQNRINALSRAVYFIALGSLGLLLNGVLVHTSTFTPACLYGFNYNNPTVIHFVRDGLFIFILFLPVLFTLGWMPQCDTFLINILEHIDIHVFGGTASTGLICSLYSLARNLFTVLCLLPLGYAAFVSLETTPGYVGSNCETTFSRYRDDVNLSVLSQQCTNGGRVALSFFLGGVVAAAYALSRATTNHQYIIDLLCFELKKCWQKVRNINQVTPPTFDPLEDMYRQVMRKRLLTDLVICVLLMIVVTVLNLTSVFCQSEVLAYVIYGLTGVLGIVNHYFLPHVRKETPYLCFSEPCIKSDEYDQFEVTEQPKVSITERVLQVSLFVEKNILYPLSFLFGLNIAAVYYRAKFGELGAAIVVSVVGMKLFRSAYSELSRQHVVLILSLLFFNFDYAHLNEGFPFNYFITAILFSKIYDLYLKIYFVLIYIMPGSWSSPFHIIIQPLLIPHCVLIFFETLIGAIVSAPMNPIIASSMFFLSYARPIKFWEKDYNTKRRDTSNTRLEQQLETNVRNPNPDHLDSLFYEQLSWSLQRDLCGDIMLGRWGRVFSGDFFILTNDQLNALVHIIEIGNGFVTFQLRGLEFRGTYCHQREREAITEPLADEDSCFCHPPYMLPCNKALSARLMAWEVVSSAYTLHGYSISENQAHLVFNAFDYKKTFVTYYVKCIVYYLFKYPRLMNLLDNENLQQSLLTLTDPDMIDLDPLFDQHRNIDCNGRGISRMEFVDSYYDFINVCATNCPAITSEIDTSRDSFLVTLCFAYSLLGRRLFFTHANTGSSRRGDNFMHGLYRMFLGDARPNCEKDDWIFLEVDSIQEVIIPAVRVALKVHQDNFTLSDDYEDPSGIYDAIQDTEENHVVTHENDRAWRDGVVLNRPSLLALRYQRTEDTYVHPYKIIRLTSKFIKFRVVKVNRECVRGLWSSQQHELIFLRNSDSERGSIQNHKASLRNMINSSMDLPIGYPIYVSPLQTSFIDRHVPFNGSHFGKITNPAEYTRFLRIVKNWCTYCANCYQGSRGQHAEKQVQTVAIESASLSSGGRMADSVGMGDESDSDDDFWKPIWIGKQVVIVNEDEIFRSFNEHWVQWPDKSWLNRATNWRGWVPSNGITGEVLHEWRPFHITATSRSHIDKVILLIKTTDGQNLVLIKEQGVQEV